MRYVRVQSSRQQCRMCARYDRCIRGSSPVFFLLRISFCTWASSSFALVFIIFHTFRSYRQRYRDAITTISRNWNIIIVLPLREKYLQVLLHKIFFFKLLQHYFYRIIFLFNFFAIYVLHFLSKSFIINNIIKCTSYEWDKNSMKYFRFTINAMKNWIILIKVMVSCNVKVSLLISQVACILAIRYWMLNVEREDSETL